MGEANKKMREKRGRKGDGGEVEEREGRDNKKK